MDSTVNMDDLIQYIAVLEEKINTALNMMSAGGGQAAADLKGGEE